MKTLNRNTDSTGADHTSRQATLKAGWNHKDLTEDQILSLRVNRALAYQAGSYKMAPPPVYTGGWDSEAWMNWVQFNNPSLTGFLPYTRESRAQEKAYAKTLER